MVQDTPLGASVGDTADPTTTLDHAAKVFEGLLFPESGEGQDTQPEAKAAADKATPADTSSTSTVDDEKASADAQQTESEAEPQPSDALKFRWVIDGEEVELTEDEAKLGYLRQRDYTKKTQTAAELRKQAEAELASAREQRASYLARLEQAKQSMDALVPKEPDWGALQAQGVSAQDIAAAVANYQTFAKNRDLVVAEQKRVAEEALADAEAQANQRHTEEQEKLLEAMPAWRDPDKGKAELAKLATWLRSQGFTEDQIAGVGDHRLVLSLYNSMRWSELQQSKPSAQAKRPAQKIVSPGGKSAPKTPASDKQRAESKLAKSGKIADAAKVFENLDL
jgi:hypothetical protein